MNDFWNYEEKWYKNLIYRHRPLWMYVLNFIKENKVESIFEVGGGYGELKNYVKEYVCVELNKEIVEEKKDNYIYGDFCKIDVEEWKGKVDLFIALAVVEHCDHYKEFLQKAIEMKPKYILISFFMGLCKLDRDRIRVRESRKGRNKGKIYFWNRYCRSGLLKTLEEFGVLNKSELVNLPCLNGNKSGEELLVIRMVK